MSGNISELKNVVERDYYISEDEIMNIDCLDYNNKDENINKHESSIEEIKIVPFNELEEKAIRDA